MTFERTEAQLKAQAEIDRAYAEWQEAGRELCEWLGLPLICPERGCGRAGRCAGTPSHGTHGMQPCLMHYREEMRFLLIGPDKLVDELASLGLVAEGECANGAGGTVTLIELLYGSNGASLERLRRPKGARGPVAWECDPDGFARYMDEGDWRDPGPLTRPVGVRGGAAMMRQP